ncbi:TetR/AcrR family transcriptional regulator [Chengkuizengella marina]|uniref:TetR/AcrR family transcriptional regulator n=1 Tax=Chengkuizengella marina TaxID=2507566 RepID=A0A6N9Q2Y7_9BACL|nr:TetR/AcrR family transcriptional regulator [Chengkuizengella marina]NBI29165.1 TetR/AcrR family transcriptional regulator [Chengkuizengella marina]
MSNTKEKIMKASIRLFAENGYQITTVKMIATKVGINELTIYRHFGSKEKILETALNNVVTIQSHLTNYFKSAVVYDFEKDLLNLTKMLINIDEDNYHFMKFFMRTDTSKLIPNRGELQDLFYEYLLQMQKMGKIVSFDIDSLALQFFSSLQGAFFLEEYKEDGLFKIPPKDKYLETMVKVFVRGLEVKN